ncbi:hypothetical protein POM88_001403 [Heracleum sosnowskyi]|uniref:Uncharacterized protein n=1 Tax=Heracleum sosnowskyi TaxID=360622 RepID=A0AAD8JDH2_9APIA|nr:hypothetical protein POM88_001403 [Heracleum sosnowskyi]
MAPLKRIVGISSSSEALNRNGVSISQSLKTSFMDGWTQVSIMFMFLLLSLLVLMVVPVIRRGASNGRRGRGRGRGTASAENRENRGGGSTGEGSSRGRAGGSGSDDDGRSPLTYYFERADRSVSCGDFHKMPKDGEPKKGIVEFTDKYINSNTQKKTLKAIVRAFWPVGPVHSAGKPRSAFFDDTFYSNVLQTFEKYYDYEQGISPREARYKIKEHLKNNLKNLLYREKDNADKRVSKAPPGTTRRDVKPLHVNRSIWDSLCDWWETQKFKAMSAQNKENRSHGGKIVHTTGAKPYIIFRKELEGENERQLTLVEFYEATHEKKGDGRGTFWTKESEDMRDLLVKSWEEYRQSLLAEVAEGEAGNEGESPISPPLSPDARDNGSNTSVPRSELDEEIQQLAAITLPKDDVHWAEYIHVASSVVDKMLDKFGKTINEDTDNGNPNLSDDDFRA